MRCVVLLAVLAVGCGKEGGGGAEGSGPASTTKAEPNSTSMLVADKASLPTCDSTRGGALAYVKAESKFYGCDGTAWAEVSIKGEKGDKGEVVQTTTPTQNKVAKTTYCNGQGNVNIGIDFSSYNVSYWATEMTSGDVWVTATVANGVIGASASNYYAKAQSGADSASVIITFDSYGANDAGWWGIELNRATNVTTATYHDAAMPTTGTRFWVYPATACTTHTY